MVRLSGNERHLLARRGHALSDETRLRILERLCAGERCVCELTGAIGAGQSRLSFHLKTLKDAGLVSDRREGKWVYYSLNTGAMRELRELVERLEDRPALPVVA